MSSSPFFSDGYLDFPCFHPPGPARYGIDVFAQEYADGWAHASHESVSKITLEHWTDMLEVLPPLDWRWTDDGVDLFTLSEFIDGNTARQYGRCNDGIRVLCASKLVQYGDRSQDLTRAEILMAHERGAS